MAIQGFVGVIHIVDAYGRITRKRVEIAHNDYNTAMGTFVNFVNALSDVIDGGITGGSLTRKIASFGSGVRATPLATANIDTGVTFHCILEDAKSGVIKIPTFKMSLVDENGFVILDNNDVEDVLGHFTTGLLRVSDGDIVERVRFGILDKR